MILRLKANMQDLIVLTKCAFQGGMLHLSNPNCFRGCSVAIIVFIRLVLVHCDCVLLYTGAIILECFVSASTSCG